MPSFSIRSAQQLADYLIPVTPEMAAEIITQANAANDGIAYAAVYYTVENRETGKRKRASVLVMVSLELTEDCFACVRTGDYHPRTEGKADLVYKTDRVIKD